MIRGLYMAGGALVQQAAHLDVVSNNLANLATVGYKREKPTFQSFETVLLQRRNETTPAAKIGSLTRGATILEDITIDFAPGVLEQSGHPLDLALQGPGFFVVRQPDGTTAYTRAGAFAIAADRALVTSTGQPVLDQAGAPILVPPGSDLVIGEQGTLTVDGVPGPRLGLVEFANPSALEKLGAAAFRDRGDAGPQATTGATVVRQGFLERSNTSALSAIAELTVILRSFEASQKMVTLVDESLRRAADDLGRNR